MQLEEIEPVRSKTTEASLERTAQVCRREVLGERAADATLKRTGITEAFTFADFRERSPTAVPLFLRSSTGEIAIISADAPLDPLPGQTVISLMPADGEKLAPEEKGDAHN